MNIPNYLVQAILVTLCCFWPVGIVAIIKAASVNGMIARGDIQGAMKASADAKKWCWIAVICWGVVVVIYILLMILGVAGSLMQSSPSNF